MTKDERIDQLSSEVMELREQLRLAQKRAADSEDKAQSLKRQLIDADELVLWLQEQLDNG